MDPEPQPRRYQLHEVLKEIAGHAYFEPGTPPNITMQYPCIVYKRDGENVKFADNLRYLAKDQYLVTVIDGDPDSRLPAKVKALPYARFDRRFAADNLIHDVFNVFF